MAGAVMAIPYTDDVSLGWTIFIKVKAKLVIVAPFVMILIYASFASMNHSFINEEDFFIS